MKDNRRKLQAINKRKFQATMGRIFVDFELAKLNKPPLKQSDNDMQDGEKSKNDGNLSLF